ncbi:condensation domain-containing protein [Streptomyces goshikiensis]
MSSPGRPRPPSYAGYNVGQYIELVGPLDDGALEEAVGRTLDEAPWLRFSVTSAGGRFRQAPVPARPPVRRLPRLDTSGAADPVAAAVDLVRGQLACPPRLELLIDPVRPDAVPDLAGAVLVTTGPRHHLLVQYFHQLVVDGYGVALLSRRIAERYTALVGGAPVAPSPFAPVSVLADAERAYTASAAHAADLAAWQERYADLPDPVWPAGRTAPAGDTALRRTVPLDPADGAVVAAAARAAGVTWGEAVVAATAAHLADRTGAREATLALFATARTAPGTLRVPGTALNVLPVRVPVGAGDTFRTLLGRAAAELTFLRGHQRVRGEELARNLWPALPGTRVPGPLVNLRPFESELDFAGTRGHVVSLASGPVDDLSVSASSHPDGRLRLDFDANPALYDAASLARYADGCAAALVAPRPGAGPRGPRPGPRPRRRDRRASGRRPSGRRESGHRASGRWSSGRWSRTPPRRARARHRDRGPAAAAVRPPAARGARRRGAAARVRAAAGSGGAAGGPAAPGPRGPGPPPSGAPPRAAPYGGHLDPGDPAGGLRPGRHGSGHPAPDRRRGPHGPNGTGWCPMRPERPPRPSTRARPRYCGRSGSTRAPGSRGGCCCSATSCPWTMSPGSSSATNSPPCTGSSLMVSTAPTRACRPPGGSPPGRRGSPPRPSPRRGSRSSPTGPRSRRAAPGGPGRPPRAATAW